ncbi:phosphoribosylformylglycinamidine cyclo-ligase [Candidatus Peregrinibacteria bacterium]|nr:phosphoribosylformylglycinamidine cyclo-ligase [Candidatus Peregrinibacteria bacterium]
MTTYKDAGVDIDAADDAKRAMKDAIDTGDKRVLTSLGSFAALVEGKFKGYKQPVLALKMEEPGSKQKLAFEHGFVRSICFDTVNHLVNDIAVMGAVPLYVQDLIICGKLEKSVVTEIVKGFSDACKEQGCVLTGGETTEQPGVLASGTYALAASVVGIVDKPKIIDGSAIKEGDTILSVASNGLHTNGYTLVRTLMEKDPALMESDVAGDTFLAAVMQPHTCYFGALKGLFGDAGLHGLAHITGGGMQGNIDRILPKGLDARIDLETVLIPPVFGAIRTAGSVPDADMLKTYNMGVGIAVVVDPASAETIVTHFREKGHDAYPIGKVVSGHRKVKFEGELQWNRDSEKTKTPGH